MKEFQQFYGFGFVFFFYYYYWIIHCHYFCKSANKTLQKITIPISLNSPRLSFHSISDPNLWWIPQLDYCISSWIYPYGSLSKPIRLLQSLKKQTESRLSSKLRIWSPRERNQIRFWTRWLHNFSYHTYLEYSKCILLLILFHSRIFDLFRIISCFCTFVV